MVTGEAGAPVSVALVTGGCARLFLTQPENVAQTRVVGTQRVQLARETLHAANG